MDALHRRELVSLDILREEYHLFRAAVPNDERLPPGDDAWLRLQFREKRPTEAAGIMDKRVPVRYHAFMRHAKRSHSPVTYSLLMAYAASLNASGSSVSSEGYWYKFTADTGIFSIVVRQRT